MSISPAKMVVQVATTEDSAPTRRSASSPAPAAESPAQEAASAPAVSSAAQLSTDMMVDDQHQIYYEFVDKSTGHVVFEIPAAALREIGESLNVSLEEDSRGRNVDMES